MSRDFNYDILDLIKKRWSARSFRKKNMSVDDILPLIEAARYAPSAYNEQPWHFLVAVDDISRNKVLKVLTDSNKLWAKNASAFLVLLSKKHFSHNDSPNNWHLFDTGTAFGFLALEAENRGIVVHPMAGFKKQEVISDFNIDSDEYEPVIVAAIGFLDSPEKLEDSLKEREHPGLRKNISEIYTLIS